MLWRRYLLGGVLLVAVDAVLPSGLGRDALFCVVASSGAAAMVVGVRRNRPAEPVGWYLIAAGMMSWVAGGAIYSWFRHEGQVVDIPSLTDAFSLSTYPLVAIGLLRFARSRGRERMPTALLDSAILAIGVGLATWVFLIAPTWSAGGNSTLSALVGAGYPLGNVLIFGAILRLAKAPGAGRTALRLLAGLDGAMLMAQNVAPVLLRAADVHPSQYQHAGLIAFVLAGATVLHPSMRSFTSAPPAGAETLHTGQLVALASALMIGPAILGGELIRGVPLHAGAVVVTSAVLVLLVLVRMVRMVGYIEDQATTDDLTGLPNRRALYRLAQARLSDPKGRRRALLMLDLDRFKEVNDSLGHHTGDQLLIQVGSRLRERLRDGDLLVRLGGDEFAILLKDTDEESSMVVAAALRAALSEPFVLENMSVHSAVSVGIALFPEHGSDLSTLLRKADIAMYQAKASGAVHLFDGGDDGASRLRMVEELRTALTNHQLVVHYQPKIDLHTGGVCGVEALVRWDHPVRGLIYPDDFLNVVEESGLMRALTRTVLQIALDQTARWHADGRPLSVAVNLSASSLVDADLPDEVAAMLAARHLPPQALRLEVTEEFLMADRDQARAILTRLRDHGIQIAVDDFGTGYSSLSYLRDLPIDELKLDRSFVVPMAGDSRAAALVAATIALAHSLDMRMVAQGVEDDGSLAELTRLGCDQAQGFYLSRPVHATELDHWLRGRNITDDQTENRIGAANGSRRVAVRGIPQAQRGEEADQGSDQPRGQEVLSLTIIERTG